MIRRYEHVVPPEPENPGEVQWTRGMAAGLIAGAILIVVPRGSPWAGWAFSDPVIMGRHFSGLPLGLVYVLHLALSVLYGLVICRLIATYRIQRALVMAGLAGLLLYVVNLGVVALIWGTQGSNNEIPVIFTHVVFALITAGAYRGLLKRKAVVVI